MKQAPPTPNAPITTNATVATLSRGIRRIPRLEQFLDARQVVYKPAAKVIGDIDYVVGWGQKAPSRKARVFAGKHGLPFVHLEDGFLRSISPGVLGEPPMSMVWDDLGIYFDATAPSRLEALLNGDSPQPNQLEDPNLLQRAERCMKRIIENRLSKYNHAPVSADTATDDSTRPQVLVVDQTAGDMSVKQGLVGPNGFQQMLEAALDEHPDADVVVKTHPDVIAKKKRGYLTAYTGHPRVRVIGAVINPIDLLKQVTHVYVATSLLGFEALMAGKPVTCFGAPFYAGWGATDDRITVARRCQKRSVAQIFAAAYILYTTYVHPDYGTRCEIEEIIEHLERQRHWFERNQGTFYGIGFSRWKQRVVRAFLRSPGNQLSFSRKVSFPRRQIAFEKDASDAQRPNNPKLLVWGMRDPEPLRASAKESGMPIWRVEDGFLRSVALGSDITIPASLIVDEQGVYYDPSQPSDLEQILQTQTFGTEELSRAAQLRQAIVSTAVSKYNIAGDQKLQDIPRKHPIILAVGQVDSDASISLGCPHVPTNEAFLQAIRQRHPDAHILYKPHPDVLSGNRKGRVSQRSSADYCDEIVTDVSVARCLDAVDEVHTRTSLVGFEALLRNKRVVVYGKPFYCGWGLTEDLSPVKRRSRRLTLDELVAGVLLRYPRYLNPASMTFTTPEFTIKRLQAERDQWHSKGGRRAIWPVRQLQRLLRFCVGV